MSALRPIESRHFMSDLLFSSNRIMSSRPSWAAYISAVCPSCQKEKRQGVRIERRG